MTTREQTLLFALIAVVGIGIGGIGVYKWFLVPFVENRRQLDELEGKTEVERLRWRTFVSERQKLVLARTRSLPANAQQAGTEYILYLRPLLKESGLTADIASSGPTKVDLPTPIPGVKKVGHEKMTFTVDAKGTLAQLVTALDHLQRTPYEHRVQNLHIEREQPGLGKDATGKLVIKMVIETLLVAKSDGKPGRSLELEPPVLDRNYDDIARKNIFIGDMPTYEEPKEIVQKKVPVPQDNVPAYVRLIYTSAALQQASLFNRIYKLPEEKLDLNDVTKRTFRIMDEDGVEFVRAKVLRVNDRDIYFQVRDRVYAWHVNDTLEEALKKRPIPLMYMKVGTAAAGIGAALNPFTARQSDDHLSLVALYDHEWAAAEKIRNPAPKSKFPGKGR